MDLTRMMVCEPWGQPTRTSLWCRGAASGYGRFQCTAVWILNIPSKRPAEPANRLFGALQKPKARWN